MEQICKICGRFDYGCGCAEIENSLADHLGLDTKEDERLLEDDITKLKVGNTILLGALMDMAYQYLSVDEDSDICTHSFMSAGETALKVLYEARMADTEDGINYTLRWDLLKERQEEWGVKG